MHLWRFNDYFPLKFISIQALGYNFIFRCFCCYCCLTIGNITRFKAIVYSFSFSDTIFPMSKLYVHRANVCERYLQVRQLAVVMAVFFS